MRPDTDAYFLTLAAVVATRGTCARRQVGCVLVDGDRHVLATGYNGPPSGEPHCTDQPCAGAGQASGAGLELCEAIHAEQNALLQCRDVREVLACYTTVFPCAHCLKLLLNTGCRHVVYRADYPGGVALRARWGRRLNLVQA